MKKSFSLILLFVFCVGLLVFSPVAMADESQQQAQFVAPRLVVNSSFLNVRSGPGVQFSVLITVVGGTELPVLGRASDNVWFQVSTVIGVGWVNVQFTVPRGSFDNVPVISQADIAASIPLPGTNPATLGLGQGGGGPAPSTTTLPGAAIGGTMRFTLADGRIVTINPGERFRAVVNVEAENLRTQPFDGSPTLGTLFRDDTTDYSIVGSANDKTGVQWLAIDVPDLGIGWVEAPKMFLRLSRAAGTVVSVAASVINMTDSPNGSGLHMPVLTSGQEAFLVGTSKDGKFIQLELGGGDRGWVPFDSVVIRTGTPTDEIDFSQVATTIPAAFNNPAANATTPTSIFPASFGLDTPHIVVNTGFLNIRSGPGAEFSTVATVPGGTELPVLGIAKDGVWFLVQGSFGRGWVNNEFTVFRGAMSAVPIIQAAATGVLATPTAVVAGTVTLYAAPGANFGAIGALTGPIEVPVVARTSDSQWFQLNTSLGFGWVVASQILLRGDASLIPVVG